MSEGAPERTILLTGANTGIGRQTALALANPGVRLYLAGRSKQRTQPVVDEARELGAAASFLPLDLADLHSVRACAESFLAQEPRLDVLVNNAGLAGHQGLTEQGFELAFGVNHLGHFLLTELLLDPLKAAAPSRIVIVASGSHASAKGIDWEALRQPTRSVSGLPEYAVSKLCNVLHAKELSRRLADHGVHTYALHPGTVASDVWRRVPWPIRPLMKLFMKSNEEGAATSVYCATSPDVAEDSGRYYDECRERKPSRLAEDVGLANELRERSLAWTESHR